MERDIEKDILKNVPISKLDQIKALGTSTEKDKEKGLPEKDKEK